MRERTGVRTAGCALAGVLVVVALSACGGSGGPAGGGVSSPRGIATPGPDALVTRATRAIEGVRSVRLTGTLDAGLAGHPLALHLTIASGRGAIGSLSESGVSFRLVVIGGSDYIRGTTSFWRQYGGASVAAELDGRWLRAPRSSGEFASLQTITDLHTLLGALLNGHGSLTRGARSTIDGRRVIALNDVSDHGTLYVATTGPPYPIRLTRAGAQGGQLDFGDFGARVRITAPVHVVALSDLTDG